MCCSSTWNEGLAIFDDNSFDMVLQINTLQRLRNAETMLRETARVGAHEA